jgi:hypothetical protein
VQARDRIGIEPDSRSPRRLLTPEAFR